MKRAIFIFIFLLTLTTVNAKLSVVDEQHTSESYDKEVTVFEKLSSLLSSLIQNNNANFETKVVSFRKMDSLITTNQIHGIDSFEFNVFVNATVDEESLLEKYAPVLYFHPDEQFFPTTIDAMLNESDLKGYGEIIDSIPVDVESLSAEDVTEDYYLDMRNASPGYYPFEMDPNPVRFDKYIDNVYGREFSPDNEHIVLQYWFFYSYNNWINNHEGDWEMIQLILNSTNEIPLTSTYSYHYEAITYNWSDINKIDETHPKVFISSGGHANYKETKSLYLPLLEFVSSNGIVLFNKKTNASEINNTKLEYDLNKINNLTNWVHFKGKWGEVKYNISGTEGPNSLTNIAYGNQPNRWSNPIEFSEYPRPDQTTAITGSPVNLHAYDKEGRHVGINEFGEIEAEIPNTYLYVPSDNGKEVIVILSNDEISFVVKATDEGAFNLSINTYNRNTQNEIDLSYGDIQITPQTIATIDITETNPNFIIQIDNDGDGMIDDVILPDNISIQGNFTNPETDSDNDGYSDSIDTCPNLYNPNQISDFDGDGFDNALCGGLDCDDSNHYIHPNAEESCNNIDDDCNGQTDELDNDDDSFNDCNGQDSCLDSIPDNFQKLNKNHFAGNWDGCSCTDILACKPGNNNGELKYGCTKGTINMWIKQIGWAKNCKGENG